MFIPKLPSTRGKIMSENQSIAVGSVSKKLVVLRHGILALGSIFALFPLIWILSTSLKPGQDVFSASIEIIPSTFAFENYLEVLRDNDWVFIKWIWNSVFVAFGTTIVGILLASSAAYAFSRFKFPGRRTGLMIFLLTQMFPGIILVIPLYEVMKSMKLLNSYVGLIIALSLIHI